MIASVIPQVTTMAEGSSNNYIESDSLSLTELNRQLSEQLTSREIQGDERSPATDLETDDRNISMPEQPIHVLKKEPHCKNKLPIGEEYVNDSKSTHTLNEAIVRAGMLELEECDREIPDEYFAVLEKPSQGAPTGKPSQRCRRILRRLFEEFGLKGLLVCDFGDRGIAVLGENAKTIEPQILAALRHLRFPNIEVVNKETDFEGVEYTEPLSCQVAKMVTILNKWELDGTVFCELVIQDDNTHGAIYAVIPAHLVLTLEQSRQLASVGSGISHTRDQVTKQGKEYKYVFKNENHEESVVLEPPPLLAYRHWEKGPAIDTAGNSIPEVESECDESTTFMNDIALLKFQSYRRDELADKVEVFPIPTKKHLDALARRGQRVIIGKHEGMLIPSPESVGSMNHHYGLHLSFIITSKDVEERTSELESGSSGLIVFFKGKQGQLIPVGMLVGKLSARLKIIDSSIYQAIVLSQALKEIEQDYPQQISNIRVLETCHRSKGSNMVTSQRTMKSAVQGDSGSQDTGAAASNMTRAQTEVKPDVTINKTPEDGNAELITQRAAESMQSEVKDQLSTDHTAPLVERPEEVGTADSSRQKQADTPPEISQTDTDDAMTADPEIQGCSDIQTDIPAAAVATQTIMSSKEENTPQAACTSADGVSDAETDQSSTNTSSNMVRDSAAGTLSMGVEERPLLASAESPHQGSDVELSDLNLKQKETPGSEVTSEMTAETGLQGNNDRLPSRQPTAVVEIEVAADDVSPKPQQPNTQGSDGDAETDSSPLHSHLETIKGSSDDDKQSHDDDDDDSGNVLETPLIEPPPDASVFKKESRLKKRIVSAWKWAKSKLQAVKAMKKKNMTESDEQLEVHMNVVEQNIPQESTPDARQSSARQMKEYVQEMENKATSEEELKDQNIMQQREEKDEKKGAVKQKGTEVQAIVQKRQRGQKNKLTNIWYRHSGQPAVDEIPHYQNCNFRTFKDESEILKDIGRHHITHIYIRDADVPSLELVAPKVRALKVTGGVFKPLKPSQLSSLNCLTGLKEMCLESVDLSDGLPPDISQLTSLEKLELRYCRLTKLPQNLSSLAKLRALDLSGNSFITGIPEVISELALLEKLWLNRCMISALPFGFSSLTNLRVLDLGRSDFSNGLPEGITELTSLGELNLYWCDLKNLPPSFSSLTNLRVLNLEYNNFSEGLPDVITELTSLEELNLSFCRLQDLPPSLKKLERLKKLHIDKNDFTTLPSVVYKLKCLKSLDLQENNKLEKLEDKLLELEQLEELNISECDSLKNPPAAVCKQGWPAVKKFFKDLRDAGGMEQRVVPVAVVGMSLSGKSSMIKSLQRGKRTLTFRDESSPLDEATKVFCVEDLILENSRVKLVDYGGHSIYHIIYQLVINELCVPAIVVNMEEYVQLSESHGSKEAARRLCVDWLAHLYVASPRLGPPILVLTHTDKLPPGQLERWKNELLSNTEIIRKEVLQEEKESSGSNTTPIVHLSDEEVPLFHRDDIVEFNNVLVETSSIERMKQCIDKRSEEFAIKIPRLWERVEGYIESHTTKPYVMLSDVSKKFPMDDPMIILRYLHNTGKILWFEKLQGLSVYIFHRIPAVTDLIKLLFDHSFFDPWSQLITKFVSIRHNQQQIGPRKFEKLVKEFKQSGEIDEVLLVYMFKTCSEFPVDAAFQLLQSFYIIHGPIKRDHGNTYILPSFTTSFLNSAWQIDGYLQLRLEIELRGLCVPEYVFQLVTVAVLNHSVGPNATVKVARNGATIRHGGCATHVVHNSSNRKIVLQVSTSVDKLGKSWKLLLENAHAVHSLLSDVWKACRSETLVYCAHCLFLRDLTPAYDVNPHWFRSANLEDISKAITGSAMELTACPRSDPNADELIPTVPQGLVRPCLQLKSSEVRKLKSYLRDQESGCSAPSQDGSYEEVQPAMDGASQDVDSELSDVEEEGYCVAYPDGERANMIMRAKPVSKPTIQLLYYNTEKVYLMSDAVRGRVLILNIKSFSDKNQTRDGSEVDYENISRLFKTLKFDIAKSQKELSNLTEMDIYREIGEETRRTEHKNLGMFVMIIMSHGGRGDVILDYHKNPVPLINIQDLLSPRKFPAMKGKPKLLIVQACSSGCVDYGDSREVPSIPPDVPATGPSGASADSPHLSHPPTTSTAIGGMVFKVDRRPELPKPPSVGNADDLFIMNASSESYLATRSITHGSWFIRVLVATFYKHACHRDVETLFKIIQSRIRQVSMATEHPESEPYHGGNVPTSICTFTHYRKLYLFPGLPRK